MLREISEIDLVPVGWKDSGRDGLSIVSYGCRDGNGPVTVDFSAATAVGNPSFSHQWYRWRSTTTIKTHAPIHLHIPPSRDDATLIPTLRRWRRSALAYMQFGATAAGASSGAFLSLSLSLSLLPTSFFIFFRCYLRVISQTRKVLSLCEWSQVRDMGNDTGLFQ